MKSRRLSARHPAILDRVQILEPRIRPDGTDKEKQIRAVVENKACRTRIYEILRGILVAFG